MALRQVSRTPEFEKNLRVLAKKHRELPKTVESELDIVAKSDVPPGDRIPNAAGQPVYKIRIKCGNKGKLGGARLIYYCAEALVLAMFVYAKSDQANIPSAAIVAALGTDANAPKLTGTVEADETYVGGKPRLTLGYGAKRKGGPGTQKTPVAGIVQRGGDVRFQMMTRVTANKLSRFIAENADLTCRLLTDEHPGYIGVGRAFEGGHGTTKHSAFQYVKPGTDIHSNTIEGVFSLLKRGVMGTFHAEQSTVIL